MTQHMERQTASGPRTKHHQSELLSTQAQQHMIKLHAAALDICVHGSSHYHPTHH
jgi:hypothetical protein